MNDQLKPPGKILLREQQIENRITELGQQLTNDYQKKAPLLVGVLNVHKADLVMIYYLLSLIMAVFHGNATKTSGVVRIVDLDIDLRTRCHRCRRY